MILYSTNLKFIVGGEELSFFPRKWGPNPKIFAYIYVNLRKKYRGGGKLRWSGRQTQGD